MRNAVHGRRASSNPESGRLSTSSTQIVHRQLIAERDAWANLSGPLLASAASATATRKTLRLTLDFDRPNRATAAFGSTRPFRIVMHRVATSPLPAAAAPPPSSHPPTSRAKRTRSRPPRRHKDGSEAAGTGPPPLSSRRRRPPLPPASGDYSLSRQLGLGVSRIVIDPGHGGHDPGRAGQRRQRSGTRRSTSRCGSRNCSQTSPASKSC